MKLRSHPRLLFTSDHWQRLGANQSHPLLKKAADIVAAQADEYVASRELLYDQDLHNSLLLRAREVQFRVWTLLVRWGMTGEGTYREAAIDYVRGMGEWTYWGWDLMREGNADPEADFELSYGENSATLAVAYDLLYNTLSEKERAVFKAIAQKWCFRPFLKVTHKKPVNHDPGWWFGKGNCNWNTVCAGGAGMLALAMYEEVPEAKKVLARADISIGPYMRELETTQGGWPEGIGYWGYGHRYAFLYLLSHEAATGEPHPLMELKGTAQTLDFPLDFCPNGNPTGFGDVNTWGPLAFHYAAARRFKRPGLVAQLDAAMGSGARLKGGAWPTAAELLLVHPGTERETTPGPRPVAKLYPRMDWGILADRLPHPRLYLSVRGGTTEVPHSHIDLGTFNCVVGRERLIDNISVDGGDEYLDTTFSSRRWELFENTPASKNVVLINGVGVARPSTVETRLLKGKGWLGIRVDLTGAVGLSRSDFPAASFYSRLFLMLDGEAALIIDRVEMDNPGRIESRMHTYSEVEFHKNHALIQGQREEMHVTFAADVPSTLHRAEDALTTPKRKSTMLRWCTDERIHREITFATALTPGGKRAHLTLETTPKLLFIGLKHRKREWKLNITPDLLKVGLAE